MLVALVALLWAGGAFGREMTHVVQKGQYLELIARRYHTTAEAIQRHNGLGPKKLLKPGMELRIEETEAHRRWRQARGERVPEDAPPKPKAIKERAKKGAKRPSDAEGASYARAPKRRGFVTLVRYGEKFHGQLVAKNGRLLASATKKIDKLLRSLEADKQIRINRKLLRLLAKVSDHFGGRSIVVVSGYRPYTPKQYTRHSKHNDGDAIDFRVLGVPNRALWEFCLKLGKVGCGYYPNSTHVHLDVRLLKTRWVDYSGPGQAPRYAHKGAKSSKPDADKAKSPGHASPEEPKKDPPKKDPPKKDPPKKDPPEKDPPEKEPPEKEPPEKEPPAADRPKDEPPAAGS